MVTVKDSLQWQRLQLWPYKPNLIGGGGGVTIFAKNVTNMEGRTGKIPSTFVQIQIREGMPKVILQIYYCKYHCIHCLGQTKKAWSANCFKNPQHHYRISRARLECSLIYLRRLSPTTQNYWCFFLVFCTVPDTISAYLQNFHRNRL